MGIVDTAQLQQWASRQLADYDARQPGTLFADGVVLNVEQAYQLQSAVVQLRCERGERVVGHKVGCTSPIIRAQLGIEHSVSGRLFESERHASGAAVSRTRFANLAIEGELAIELSREPNESDFSEVSIPACVARVFPVIELHNHVMRGEQASAAELIANNAIHAGFVTGEGLCLNDTASKQFPDSAALSISVNDQLLEECSGSVLIQTIHSSLKWLAETVRNRGGHLQAGEIILTGSIPSLFPIVRNGAVRVDAPPFGSVTAELVS